MNPLRKTRQRFDRRRFAQGHTLRENIYVSHVPDRFTRGNLDRDLMEKYLADNRYNNSGDLSRFFFLSLVSDQLRKDGIRGDTAELGVYRGNTAIFVANLAEQMGRKAYLFDTFQGFPEQDLTGIDRNKAFEFADTSLEAVKALVDSPAAVYIQGYFPASIQGNVPDGVSFCLAHIDCDLYGPCLAALEYFYPRLIPGGFLIVHDYSSMYWDGVESAVDEFFRDKGESLIPVPDKSGTAVIRKSKAGREFGGA